MSSLPLPLLSILLLLLFQTFSISAQNSTNSSSTTILSTTTTTEINSNTTSIATTTAITAPPTTTTTPLVPKRTPTVTWNNTKTLSLSHSEYKIEFKPRGLPNQNELRVASEILGIVAGVFSNPLTSMAVIRGMSIYQLAGCNHQSRMEVLELDDDHMKNGNNTSSSSSTSGPPTTSTTLPPITTTTTTILMTTINDSSSSGGGVVSDTTISPDTSVPRSNHGNSDDKSTQLVEWIYAPIPFPESFFPDSSLAYSTRGGPARAAIISFMILFIIVGLFSILHGYISFFGWTSFSKCNCGWTDMEWWWALASVSPVPKFLGLAFSLFSGFWFRAMGVLAGGVERSSFLLDAVVLIICPMCIAVLYIGNFFFRTFKPVLEKHHGTKQLGVVESVACCDPGMLEKMRKEEEDGMDDEIEKSKKKKHKRKNRKKKTNGGAGDETLEEELVEEVNSESSSSDDSSSDDDQVSNSKHQPSPSQQQQQQPKKWKLRLLRFFNSSLGHFFFVGSSIWESSESRGSTSKVLIDRCGKYLLTDFIGIERQTNQVALLSHYSESSSPSSPSSPEVALLLSNLYHNNNNNNNPAVLKIQQQLFALQQRYDDETGTVDDDDDQGKNKRNQKFNPTVSFAGRSGGTEVVISIRHSLTAYSFFVHLFLCSIVAFLSGIARSKLLAEFPFITPSSFDLEDHPRVEQSNLQEILNSNPCGPIRGLCIFFEVIHVLFFLYNCLYLRPGMIPFENLLNALIEASILASTFLMSKSENADLVQSLLAGMTIGCSSLMILMRLFSLICLKLCDGAKIVSQWKYSRFLLEQMMMSSTTNNESPNQNNNTEIEIDEEENVQYQQQQQNARLLQNSSSPSSSPTQLRDVMKQMDDDEDNQENSGRQHDPTNPSSSPTLSSSSQRNYEHPFANDEKPKPLPCHPLSQPHRYHNNNNHNPKNQKGNMWEKEFEDIDEALRKAHAKGDDHSTAQFRSNLDKLFSV